MRASVCPDAARACVHRPPLLHVHAVHFRISHKPGLGAGVGPSPPLQKTGPKTPSVHALLLSTVKPPAVPGLRVWPEVLEVEMASGGQAEGTARHCGSWGPDHSTPLTPPHGLKFRTRHLRQAAVGWQMMGREPVLVLVTQACSENTRGSLLHAGPCTREGHTVQAHGTGARRRGSSWT